mmetsp:Transcript_108627/g.215695  ORF Transcript_108627/g.215695 Transcript_108627/m.215695 type:complete len:88 (-) Transcript_108627:172-435(-)
MVELVESRSTPQVLMQVLLLLLLLHEHFKLGVLPNYHDARTHACLCRPWILLTICNAEAVLSACDQSLTVQRHLHHPSGAAVLALEA